MTIDLQMLAEAKTLLKEKVVASLATISSLDTGPEASIVYYHYDGVKNIYFATSQKSRKIINIQAYNKVALTVCDIGDRKEMQIRGLGTVIEDKDESSKQLLTIYNSIRKYLTVSKAWPLMELHPQNFSVVKVTIEEFKYSHFTDKAHIIEGPNADLAE
jgi:nitroimidazol reductase NimA-like FMN-containing flavoprotein (pyridoxamine 5'-phosphate oxidase superfamily)